MSELINTRDTRADFRWQLLATVSALSLLTTINVAKAEGEGRPTVWLELGGQLERIDGGQEQFIPPFIANSPRAAIWKTSPASVQRAARYAVGGEAKITFDPINTDWILSASIRYGRSHGVKAVAQQTALPTLVTVGSKGLMPPRMHLADKGEGKNKESHSILDFKAGKDVGLGAFGGRSTFSAGVRFAQFNTSSNVSMGSRPQARAIMKVPFPGFILPYYYAHNFEAYADRGNSFRGIGPSLSWDGSVSVAGSPDTALFNFDWGLSAALLFGRQKAHIHHQTTGLYSKVGVGGTKYARISGYDRPTAHTRSRSVIVPNLGGFANVSAKFPNAKVSLGYRADYFFGAMDGGLDARKSYDRAFRGPFATMSIGLGG